MTDKPKTPDQVCACGHLHMTGSPEICSCGPCPCEKFTPAPSPQEPKVCPECEKSIAEFKVMDAAPTEQGEAWEKLKEWIEKGMRIRQYWDSVSESQLLAKMSELEAEGRADGKA